MRDCAHKRTSSELASHAVRATCARRSDHFVVAVEPRAGRVKGESLGLFKGRARVMSNVANVYDDL